MSSNLYLARVVGECCTFLDDDKKISKIDTRLQVKILPQMEDIADTECPKWPFFFKDEVFTGKADDLVWCISDDDFNIGYVLGPANYNTYCDEDYDTTNNPFNNDKIYLSFPGDLLNNISTSEFYPAQEGISFNNIKVTYWDKDCIHFVERSTGGSIIAYSSGSFLIMRPSRFMVHIGSQTKGSTFSIDSGGISLNGASLKLAGDYVGLGTNPTAGVLITNGKGGEGAIVSEAVKA